MFFQSVSVEFYPLGCSQISFEANVMTCDATVWLRYANTEVLIEITLLMLKYLYVFDYSFIRSDLGKAINIQLFQVCLMNQSLQTGN